LRETVNPGRENKKSAIQVFQAEVIKTAIFKSVLFDIALVNNVAQVMIAAFIFSA